LAIVHKIGEQYQEGKLSQIRIEDYKTEWAQQFEQLKAVIWPAVKAYAEAIEHVGSTSVPGLAAKPVIDIDIVVSERSKLAPVIEALKRIGYDHLSTMGIEDREAFRSQQPIHHHNLYVCIEGGVALQNHLLLRNALRKNSNLRDEYSQLKKGLAQKYPDSIDSYVEGKTDFILKILESGGIHTDHLGSIRAANQAPKKSLS
jgi:GrpB-like predicted nucleotidyltransferase (UPF0157 family)